MGLRMLSNSSIENYFPSALTANTSAQTSTHSLLLAESGGSPSPLKAVDGKADGLKWVRFGAQCSTSASGNNWPCGQGNRVLLAKSYFDSQLFQPRLKVGSIDIW